MPAHLQAYEGSGTEGSPYQINNLTDFQTVVNAGGHIILTADIYTETYLTIAQGKEVTINLNGYKIDRGMTNSTYYDNNQGQLFKIYGTLIIKDENTGTISYNPNPEHLVDGKIVTGGLLTGARSVNPAIQLYSSSNATLALHGGTITGNYRETYNSNLIGSGIFVLEGTNLHVKGNPKVYGNKIVNRYGDKTVRLIKEDNIYIYGNDNKIQIDGPLTSGAELHFIITSDGDITNGYNTYNSTVDPSSIFIPEDNLFAIEWNSGHTEAKKKYYIANVNNNGTTVTLTASGSAPNASDNTYNALNSKNDQPGWGQDHSWTIQSYSINSDFSTARPTTCYMWFSTNLNQTITLTGLQYLNTSEVTNMHNMFCGLSNSTLDVSHFNTEKVTDMSYMFNICSNLTSLDVSSFNTGNVTKMTRMFRNCSALTSLTIGSNFNTSKLTEYSPFVEGLSSLNTFIVKGATVPNITQDDFLASITIPALVVQDGSGATSNMLDDQVSVSNDGYVMWKGGKFASINGKKLLRVSTTIANWTYGGSPSTPEALTGDDADKAASVSYSYKLKGSESDYSADVPTAAGDYIMRAMVTPTAENAASYITTPIFVEFKILPITVGLSWGDPGELVYDGTAKALTVTPTGIINSDPCTVTSIEYDDNVNAGTHTATATALSNPNYTLPTEKTQSFTINKKSVTVSGGITASNKVYDGTASATVNTEGATFTGLIGGDALTVTATGTFDNANVGVGKTVAISGLTLGGTSVANYQLAESGHQASTTANITKKTLTVTADNASRAYGTANPAFGISYDGFVNEETASNLTTQPTASCTATATSNVGTYPITLGGGESTNYYLTYVNGELTITQKEISIQWSEDRTFEYDGTAKSLTATATGLVGTDECTVTVVYPYYDLTATDGTTGSRSDVAITHYYWYLVDGILTLPNVWCSFGDNKVNGIWFVEFNTPGAVNPIGYTLITGEDTQSYPSRNPMSWVLKAKLNVDDDWTTIATVTDDSRLEALNNKSYDYPLSNTGGTYQYFRYEVSKRHTELYDGTSHLDAMQLADLHLITTTGPQKAGTHTAYATALSNPNYKLPTTGTSQTFTIGARSVSNATISFDSPTVDYTGSAVRPGVTVTDEGGVITADDYTISEGGTDPGSYTVTITGQGNYTGSAESTATYKVVYPLTPAKAYTTYVSPFDLQMPDGQSGLTAYTVQSVTESLVMLQEETAVFKDVPMILIGTAETIYRLEKAEGKTISATRSDKLKKGSVVCTGSTNYYVLQNTGTGAEFVWANSGTVPEGKCYLDLTPEPPSGARNRSLLVVIGDGTTSLRSLEESGMWKEERGMWYSLDGRKLDGVPQKKGLYIHNGQKVVIK
jgi:surface protein